MRKAKFRFIQRHIDVWPVSTMCRALKVTRAGFYAWAKRPLSAHDKRDLELVAKIGEVYERSRGIYGAPDLVRRDFEAQGPNEVWFADVTYVRTHQGWLYLAIVMDIWSRKIVGWSMDSKMDAALVDDALKMAIERRRPQEGLIHHSDHGSQYGSLLLGKTMREHGIRPSMGAIQSPWDNAATESLMGIIKSECVHARTFATREEATLELFEYIEVFYNRFRIHSALEWMSPEQFEETYWKDRSRAA